MADNATAVATQRRRRPFVGGNWKCSADVATVDSIVSFLRDASPLPDTVDTVVAPSHLHIGRVKDAVPASVHVAAQNIHSVEGYGAYTGEHSAAMLRDFGLEWVILGHSERRHIFGESDEQTATKVRVALDAGLRVILCVGETLEEREANATNSVVQRQLEAVRAKLTGEQDWSRLVVAYEPVWAIGTGKTATSDQAQEVHAMIREWLTKHVSSAVAGSLRLIYGGSVKADNADGLIGQSDVDGFLVGGASLKPDFVRIVQSAAGSA